MNVQLSYKEGVLTARLFGEIDHHSAKEMREAIDDTAQKLKPYCLRLDFTGCGCAGSGGGTWCCAACRPTWPKW